ncbi:MAG: hypothetical protein GEU28_05765 [Dehalococcoidia bacterium]|nr:hypothetical protein [Dehalococcoidia bacterium]
MQRKIAALFLLLALIAIAVACGDDDDNGLPDGGDPESEATAEEDQGSDGEGTVFETSTFDPGFSLRAPDHFRRCTTCPESRGLVAFERAVEGERSPALLFFQSFVGTELEAVPLEEIAGAIVAIPQIEVVSPVEEGERFGVRSLELDVRMTGVIEESSEGPLLNTRWAPNEQARFILVTINGINVRIVEDVFDAELFDQYIGEMESVLDTVVFQQRSAASWPALALARP